MKPRIAILLAACAALTLPASAQYTPYFTDQMQSYQSAYWTQNYTAGYGTTLAFAYNSYVGRIEMQGVGSYISKVAVPDGTNSYDVKATVLGTANSVGYDLYLRASLDADIYYGVGTFYDVQYFTSGSYVRISKIVGGVWTILGATTIPTLHDGDTIRAMINDSGDISAYVNDAFTLHVNDQSISSGKPGIGIWNYYNLSSSGTTYGSALTNVQIGPADRTAPTPITMPTASAYATHIDFSWPAEPDGSSGTGIAQYTWYRNYQWMANTTSLSWSDTTVQPGAEYVYTFQVTDRHWNIVTPNPINVTATTSGGSPTPPDGRQIGIRSTGTYWGAGAEQIDVLSGNVNYTVPLLTAVGRTGWSVPFNLTYNSQNWRKDSGGTWNLGADVGYGYGWKLMAGSLLPVYSGATLSYYSFTDTTGAQYRLDINTGGIWTSRESVYLEYDSNVSPGRLYFRNGQFWVMGCTSAAGQPDQGTMYPTIIQDTNGNQVQISYQSSASARISAITDLRGIYYLTYAYDATAVPSYHLSAIYDYYIGTGRFFTFTLANQTLQSPFSPYTSYGTTKVLTTIAHTYLGTQHSFTYDSDNSGALAYAYSPFGGYLRWTYRNVTYTGASAPTYREVQNRYLSKDGVSSTLYPFSHEASTANLHQYTIIDDPGGVGEKYWAFSLSGPSTGMLTQYQGRQLPGPVTKTQNDLTWGQDSVGNLSIRSSLTTLDPGQSYQAQKKTIQDVDTHGNITQVYQYGFNSLTSPDRVYTYQYLAPNSTYHIYDRLTQGSVSWGLGTTLTLVTNTYTSYTDSTNFTAPSLWDSTYASASPRSNLASSTTPNVTRGYNYNPAGALLSRTVNGVSSAITPDSSHGYAVPSQITTGSVSDTLTYNSFLGVTNDTGQNGDTGSMSYDPYTRPLGSISPFGAGTSYTYNATTPYTSSNPSWSKATVNGRWTKTTLDGLGRTVKVETGDGSGTKSQVDTEYDSCGCAPAGKLKRSSLPHAPGGTVRWTTNTYDGIGRTLSVQAPDGASTTSYAYQGNVVTVTDPAGAWKKYTSDAYNRLIKVEEPNPAGGSYLTDYKYDQLDHLIEVSLTRPTGVQKRKFDYIDPATGQTGAFLRSATNPENGTVSYYYGLFNRLSTIIDAKNQAKTIIYDSMGRVSILKRLVYSAGTASYVEDPMQRTTFYYDTNPFSGTYSQKTLGRLAAVQYYGGNCASYASSSTHSGCDVIQEWYSYGAPGNMVGKKLNVTRGSATGSLTASLAYDNEGRVTGVTYPSWQGCAACSTVNGSAYIFTYDSMGRRYAMGDTVNSFNMISSTTYGVANEALQLTSGHPGVSNETRTYNNLFQLTQLQVGSTLNMTYAYSATQNNGKITSETDALSGEQVLYTYDSLNRLASAQTAGAGGWGQSYTYDGFGNLTDQTLIKGSAPDVHVAYNYLTNRQTGDTADANGNIGSGYIYDIENRLVQPGASATAHYAYDAGNKRVWRGDTSVGTDEIAFWSGQKLATYQISTSGSSMYFTLTSTNVYFGSKLISKGTYNSGGTGDKVTLSAVAADRLGSIGKFYPYGVERPSATGNDKEKFTGYFRDGATGLDYADQRYEQPGAGRFMTPDSAPSAKLADPGSWNKYAYVGGDPINRTDPTGQYFVDAWGGWSYFDAIYSNNYYLAAEQDAYAFAMWWEMMTSFTPVYLRGSSSPAWSENGFGTVDLASVDWDAVFSFGQGGSVSIPMPWPEELPGTWTWTVEGLAAWLRQFPALAALAASVGTISDGSGLPPDPKKCPENFWDGSKAPHYGWKWQDPVGNRAGYWYNAKSPGQRLHPHLEWEGNKPPHWDYTDSLGKPWECDQNGNIHEKGVKWWE